MRTIDKAKGKPAVCPRPRKQLPSYQVKVTMLLPRTVTLGIRAAGDVEAATRALNMIRSGLVGDVDFTSGEPGKAEYVVGEVNGRPMTLKLTPGAK